MPAALDVNKEAVQVLVGAVGVREAARQMGLSENTVLAWANRGGWVQQIAVARERKGQSLAMGRSNAVQSVAIKPATALENVLLERQERTKLAQSAYLAKASERLAEVPDDQLLDHAPTGKTLAEMASKVYPEATVDQSTHLSFFSVSMGRPGDYDESPVIDTPAYDPMDDF